MMDIWHQSQRGYFAGALYEHMKNDDSIWLLVGDLGYGMFDKIRADFPERFINCGAAEQTMLDMAVGLALAGKKPFCYSITPFLLYRAFEMIRTYINHELIPVQLIGSGRDNDYAHDGFSHDASDAKKLIDLLYRIQQWWPENKEEIPGLVKRMVAVDVPQFISLKR